MPQKFRDEKFRTDADIRPGFDPDARNERPAEYPGCGHPDESLRHGGSSPAYTSIRNVRVGDIAGFGSGELGPMELSGKTVTPKKVPAPMAFEPRPMVDAGPLEMQRLAQQQRNAIAMGAPDFAPMRELDYENLKKSK
jgi:hypothetical protein